MTATRRERQRIPPVCCPSPDLISSGPRGICLRFSAFNRSASRSFPPFSKASIPSRSSALSASCSVLAGWITVRPRRILYPARPSPGRAACRATPKGPQYKIRPSDLWMLEDFSGLGATGSGASKSHPSDLPFPHNRIVLCCCAGFGLMVSERVVPGKSGLPSECISTPRCAVDKHYAHKRSYVCKLRP